MVGTLGALPRPNRLKKQEEPAMQVAMEGYNGVSVGIRDPISSALDELVTRCAGLIRKVAWQHGLQHEQDELMQDVRIRIWRSLGSRERIEEAPAGYVYRAALSAAVDRIRRRRARREDPVERLPQRSGWRASREPDQQLGDSRMLDTIEAAIETLQESRRPAVRLHLVGYHRNEIAQLMGWTEAKTRNLLYRGLGDLRDQLRVLGLTPESLS